MKHPGEVNLRVVFADGDAPSLDALGLLLDGLEPLLKEYAKAYIGEPLKWDISQLKVGSINLGIFPEQKSRPHLEDPLRNMSKRFISDLEILESSGSADSTILGMDPRAWSRWVQLIKQDNVIRVEIESEGQSAILTPAGAGSLELPRAPGMFVDSVRGVIQGVIFSTGNYFTLHRERDNHPIRCYFPERMADEIIPVLRKRVIVTGRVRRDSSGEWQSLTITVPPRKLRTGSEIPKVADLVGIAPDLVVTDIFGDREPEAESVH